ncbi:MAG TPA: glutamine synthetase III [Spirochaetota bacterium]|nr:glutamine synthetase III [Spirochaetota bacterium]HOL57297.1 glutamine synthetase III [Spirochaetota bacterium]HPP03227.1 glutamine synthetase III [Spirochaetota bacterium]
MSNPMDFFGENVFSEKVMKERLPKEVFKSLKKTIDEGIPLDPKIADVVANAMKDWAIEKGATHYTHWFQPLTGMTAEKHDSFINPVGDGTVIYEFSGKQLIQGEPDASSFPSGGLRATFEARGYTAWDCTSPAFIKEDSSGGKTLYIPTAFCSYNGEALDKKTPLLRANVAINKHALRLLRALGNTTSKSVKATVGPEQEYFLIDKTFYEQRLDLILTGRTLFGAKPPKGQELEDQYFGSIKDRISSFMIDLDKELWKMGITSKTKHNEVAPAQYEMAPIFFFVNIAADHNQLVMETMQRVALRHNLVCLLHEKPFAGVNGSGKHNNYSLGTDDGINLFDPGHTPQENLVFLASLAALLKAVDTHSDILRATAASAGNDHRLGANEAPPAIISIFLGDALTNLLEQIASGKEINYQGKSNLKIGVDTLPELPKDNTDRNRTSPLAFTGNKFEFRMVGSSFSIAGPNVALNTILAEAMDEIATRLEKTTDKKSEVINIVREYYTKHKRIVFNGNNYSEEWVKEAEKRGLPNKKNTPDALKSFVTEKAFNLFAKYNIFTREELKSRYDIYLEQYCKVINIEGKTAVRMVKTQYIPAVIKYQNILSENILKLKEIGVSVESQSNLLKNIGSLLDKCYKKVEEIEKSLEKAHSTGDIEKEAIIFRDEVLTGITELREYIDTLEILIPDEFWPVPTYVEMLFLSAIY